MLFGCGAFVWGMADSGLLFWLILSALTLVIIGMFLMACMMLMGGRQKRGDLLSEGECAHFFGYLSSYPGLQAIPGECFGCTLAIDCIRAERGSKRSGEGDQPTVAEPVRQQLGSCSFWVCGLDSL